LKKNIYTVLFNNLFPPFVPITDSNGDTEQVEAPRFAKYAFANGFLAGVSPDSSLFLSYYQMIAQYISDVSYICSTTQFAPNCDCTSKARATEILKTVLTEFDAKIPSHAQVLEEFQASCAQGKGKALSMLFTSNISMSY
jgi:hypothetical protein